MAPVNPRGVMATEVELPDMQPWELLAHGVAIVTIGTTHSAVSASA